MILHHGVAQEFVGDVGVDFRCAHAGVTEHLLDGQEVGAAFQEMCGEAVAEGVRTDGLGDAVLFGEVFHDEEDHLAGEACATAVQEYRISEFRFWRDVQPCAFDVLVEDLQAAVADGH